MSLKRDNFKTRMTTVWQLFRSAVQRSRQRDEEKSIRGILLDQILVFPMVVVLLASVTFLLGGRCALWQWWASVAIVLALPFWRNGWKKSAFVGISFLLFLVLLWIVSGISITREWWDSHAYHFPVIRMLMLGWNPVWDYSCEAIRQASGGGQISLWAVFSMPRPVWYFSAVSSFFTQNQFDLYHPIVLFFLCSGIGFLWKSFRGANIFVKIFVTIFVLSITQIYEQAPDMVVSLSALGLFAVQYAYFKGDMWSPLPMVCFSFWMCSAKQTGIAFCAVDWFCFVIIVLVREYSTWRDKLMRFLKIGGVITVLFIVANISPYFTSWVHYSHPLYPQFTFNEEKYPKHNFTADFLNVNDDAKAMSNRLAMFLNAYVSSDLVRDYYSWYLDRPNFRPWGRTWRQGGGTDGWDTQLKINTRCWIMIPIMLLLLFGGLAERFVSLVLLLCMVAMPTEMIGLLRYVTLVQFSLVFCIPLLWSLTEKRWLARALLSGCLVWICWGRLCDIAQLELRFIDGRLSIYEGFKRGLPEILYYNKFARDHQVTASLNLMQRLVPQMKHIKLATIPSSFYYGSMAKKLRDDGYPVSPDLSFRVPKWYGLENLSRIHSIRALEPRPKVGSKWALSFFEFKVFWKSFMADIPRAVWLRITGEIDNHMRKDVCKIAKAPVSAYSELASDFLDCWSFYVVYDNSPKVSARIQCISEMKVSYPGWMTRNGLQGISVEGEVKEGECSLTFPTEGEIKFTLIAPSINDATGKSIPVFADFESFKINGQEVLEKPVSVLDKSGCRFYHRCHVKKGETLKIAARLRPHRYPKDELRRILLAGSNETLATEDIVDRILADPGLKKYIEE